MAGFRLQLKHSPVSHKTELLGIFADIIILLLFRCWFSDHGILSEHIERRRIDGGK